MERISLSAAARSVLQALGRTADQIEETQNRISTALKVESAIDDPESYFVAKSLNDRASDFLSLKDTINQNVRLIETTRNFLLLGVEYPFSFNQSAICLKFSPLSLRSEIVSYRNCWYSE